MQEPRVGAQATRGRQMRVRLREKGLQGSTKMALAQVYIVQVEANLGFAKFAVEPHE